MSRKIMVRRMFFVISAIVILAGILSFQPGVSKAASISDANKTIFGPNVYVFDSSMGDANIQNVADAIFSSQETAQFGNGRYALLFKPGTYNVDVRVGFYTTVAGLGQNPADVQINGGVDADAQWANANATTNFWRSIENFTVNPSTGSVRVPSGTAQWAVSQAAPMRRVHVQGNLYLFDFDSNWNAGWASGGFISDSLIDGKITPASQQQFFSRNNQYGEWANGVWNMVFVGDETPPAASFPDPPYTVVNQTPNMREKPYLYVDGSGQYRVFVPSLQTNTRGISWIGGNTPGQSISIDQFYIARSDTSSAADINNALNQGKHILFTPGIYHLNETIQVNNPNTVILGLGYPTLIPDNGQVAMKVADVDGVKVAGLLFEAGPTKSSSLMEVGPANSSQDHSANPVSLHDLFFGIGGFTPGTADVGLEINSNDVIGDHFWIWRADHGAGAGWTSNVSKNGLIVNGNDVTIYGLFNEHHEEFQTLWNGNGGRLYFYQSELPYDVPNQSAWMSHNGTVNGYASYKVADSVSTHEAWGLGVYSYFRDSAAKLNSAIEVPDVQGVKIHHMTTIWLSGTAGSEITHVINNIGNRVYANSPAEAMRQTVSEFQGTGAGGGGDGGALDRTGWTATSSPISGEPPANLLDGSMSTRWSTGTAMSPGQYIIVDMKNTKTFDQIVMDSTGSDNDYARGYEVYVSDDGTNWGSAVASGSGSGPVVTVTFPAQSARYIKVVQTGSASYWWSIREFYVMN
ncbi:MAG TPA: discoidin domain-containing protein [Bacilli bacterium]